jgi:hypothetical protein
VPLPVPLDPESEPRVVETVTDVPEEEPLCGPLAPGWVLVVLPPSCEVLLPPAGSPVVAD